MRHACHRLPTPVVKHQICNISGDRLITKTIARIRTALHRRMEFDRDGGKTYRNCDICLDTELTSAHIFDCPDILAALPEIGALFSTTNFYVDNVSQNSHQGPWSCLIWSYHGYDIIIVIILTYVLMYISIIRITHIVLILYVLYTCY
ncbi:uncharacterized protein TNCV_1900411 [Trichonephila clavipes]|nr:uncharacterized protein TNCV_1900411 [Trichonephila clavipes]